MRVGDATENGGETAGNAVSEPIREIFARRAVAAITRPRVITEVEPTPHPPRQFRLAEPLTEPPTVPLAVPLEVAR